jgi:FlaA1/EpsC-like NDP-sugar epimerase
MTKPNQTSRATAGFVSSLIRLPTAGKQLTLAGFDLVLVWATLWLAMAIRLETLSPFAQGANLVPFLLGASIICLPVFYWFGLYKTVVRFIGLVALVAIAKAVLVATGLNVLLLQLSHPEGLPRSVPVIHGLLLLLALVVIIVTEALAALKLGKSRRGVLWSTPLPSTLNERVQE